MLRSFAQALRFHGPITSGVQTLFHFSACCLAQDKGRMAAFLAASDKAINALDTKLTGIDYYHQHADVAFYFKAITALFLGGKTTHAFSLLDHVKRTFLQPNDDIISPNLETGKKSANEAYNEYWSYVNGWVAMAAQRMGRFDVGVSIFNFMKTFFHPKLGGCTIKKAYDESSSNICDVFSSAHLGFVALYFSDTDLAISCGNFIGDFISKQDQDGKFFLRMNDEGFLMKEFPPEAALFHVVSAAEANQACFMLGYPMAFLAKLYQSTSDVSYIESADKIFRFLSGCHESLYSFHFSHKVAWGCALLASVSKSDEKKEAYLAMSKRIADYLVSIQDEEGTFLRGSPEIDDVDQSSEIAVWLREVSCIFS